MKICLLNDSFPPIVDGVSFAVCNYAEIINKKYGEAMAVIPDYPITNDDRYSFPVIRYKSFKETRASGGYRIGNCFSRYAKNKVCSFAPDILHCHTPIISLVLSKRIRKRLNIPLVLTYHTKFDIEADKWLKTKFSRWFLAKLGSRAIGNCDEVWTVTEGAVQSLRNVGYNGEVIIMRNGVDMPKGKADQNDMEKLRQELNLPENVLVYLFVGRMVWYKGIKLIIDALAKLKTSGKDFRMIFVGDGLDMDEIQQYACEMNITDKCIFTGFIMDRNTLRTYYSITDLFILPSTYDNCPLTVQEALASACPSLLIKGSASADIFSDETALLVDENSDSIYEKLSEYSGPDGAKRLSVIGENALNTLYFSWEDAVDKAVERYKLIISRYQR